MENPQNQKKDLGNTRLGPDEKERKKSKVEEKEGLEIEKGRSKIYCLRSFCCFIFKRLLNVILILDFKFKTDNFSDIKFALLSYFVQ